ncbi:MAG: two-component system, chemotaxis family, CheB/CheR fusion protein [Thiomicrorhabdus sp.]|nr:MAG: two-component system, chemotaxis family, CheB/CheR fusion protein [Thiomicrorhabdus sp.]
MLNENKAMLQHDSNQLMQVFENSHSLIIFKSLSGHFTQVNRRFYELFGLSESDVIGKTFLELFSQDCHRIDQELDQMVLDQDKNQTLEREITVVQNNTQYSFISTRFPVIDHTGKVDRICCILTDISHHKSMEQRINLAQRIIENTHEGVVITSLDGKILDVNSAYTKITGYGHDELIGKNPHLLKSGRHDKDFYKKMWTEIIKNGSWSGEIWDRRKNGEVYPKWLMINAITDDKGQTTSYLGIFNDITKQKQTEEEIQHLAYYDALTNLPNRTLFKDRLSLCLSNAKRDSSEFALIFIDLDRFKIINDSLGHNAGDQLLEIIAERLQSIVRESDTVARLSGDEFAIILPDLRLPEDASIVAQTILSEIQKPCKIDNTTIQTNASIGISTFPNDGESTSSLIKYAELALYKTKETGRNGYQFFSQALQDAVFDQITLEEEIRTAIAEDQLTLYYQPKINLATQKVVGMEALVRWIHPKRGLIPPDHFIPFSEECGLILPMGDWILETAIRQSAEWSAQLEEPLVVAINLSAKQFKQPGLLSRIEGLIEKHQIKPEHIELEITESSVMDDVEEALETMISFRKIGLKLAIDDFGTGYSSLSYLKRFPINTLKIDQSFVRDLTIDSDDAAIVEVIISLAEKLKLGVVAEGVETKDQLDFLTKKGCQSVQGYFISRPLPSANFEKYIMEHA